MALYFDDEFIPNIPPIAELITEIKKWDSPTIETPTFPMPKDIILITIEIIMPHIKPLIMPPLLIFLALKNPPSIEPTPIQTPAIKVENEPGRQIAKQTPDAIKIAIKTVIIPTNAASALITIFSVKLYLDSSAIFIPPLKIYAYMVMNMKKAGRFLPAFRLVVVNC